MDAGSGAEIARVELGVPITPFAFSLDGTRLATACHDGTARILEGDPAMLDPAMLIERLCKSRVGRNLIRDEWRQYIGDPDDWRSTCPEWRMSQ